MWPASALRMLLSMRRAANSAVATSRIPAMVRALTDDQVLEIQIIENLQRDLKTWGDVVAKGNIKINEN